MSTKMSNIMMSEADFIDLIGAYGAKPENWPQERRADMQAFCRDNPQGEALLGREKMLDGWLDSQLPQVGAALEARLEAAMRQELQAVPTKHSAKNSADNITSYPAPTLSRPFIASAMTALAACFVGGFIAAPMIIDIMSGGGDLMASLDIINDIFLPTEPL